MWIGLFTVRVERGRGRVCGAPPTPLARAHSSTPRDSPSPPHFADPPYPSWDHMFLCNGFCCSPPMSVFLAVKFTLQLFYFTCKALLRYHLILVTKRLVQTFLLNLFWLFITWHNLRKLKDIYLLKYNIESRDYHSIKNSFQTNVILISRYKTFNSIYNNN